MPSFSVPSPCAQSWDHMTPATHGRYCAACEKVVVDFSCMNEAELLDFFAAHPLERVCGRFRPDQLEQPRPAPSTTAPSWARWLATAAVALSSCEMPPPLVGQLDAQQATAATEFFTVRGHVTDRLTRVPLANAYITCLQDTTHTVRTEFDGSFELLLPMSLMGSKLAIEANDNYHTTRIVASTPTLDIDLGSEVMGAIVPNDSISTGAAPQEHVLILGTPSIITRNKN
ncbi:hypothetical protein [Hymenobacter sp. GOD-10R]|uniref:hypothetical protein n=1 Tax=Hymenobacter sp. GOD-10R TaxID=3093922 RepID=UPI002D7A3629|nr:hypothetical protein [Hymenobacter sp. GOD-10R]WRQ28430.1 hypothetical protein SD425_25495 [Hymenobacter sp. GOD-10R]